MITLFGWEKGGVGKTTICVQIAAMLQLAGADTIIVDSDKQGSASDWVSFRNSQEVDQIACSSRSGKAVALDSANYATKYDQVVIDAGGRDSAELRFAMSVADIMVMPVRPGSYDIWALSSMVKLKNEVEERMDKKLNIKAFVNAANTATSEAAETMAFLNEHFSNDFTILKTIVYDRVAHRRATRDGLSVVELPKEYADAKAAREMTNLYNEIYNHG